MAATLDHLTLGSNTSATTVDASHTLGTGAGSGSNRKLVAVAIAGNGYNASHAWTGVVLDPDGGDEAAFTEIVNIKDPLVGNRTIAGAWYLDEASIPASGTFTIRATSAASIDELHIVVYELHDAAQGAVADSDSALDGAGTPTLTLTTSADDFCVDGFCGFDNRTATVGAGQTERLNTNSATGVYLFSSEVASGASTALSWMLSNASARPCHVAVAISGAGGASTVGAAMYYYSQQ